MDTPAGGDGGGSPDLSMDASPMQRTQKSIAKAFGANRAARAAAMAVCSGERLTRRQKRAFFSLANEADIDPGAAVLMMRLSDGAGVTAAELAVLETEARAASVPNNLIRGFEGLVAENAGPGSISGAWARQPCCKSARVAY